MCVYVTLNIAVFNIDDNWR